MAILGWFNFTVPSGVSTPSQLDPRRGFELVTAAANGNNPWGLYFLAMCYYQSYAGVQKDEAKFFELIQRAADMGHTHAQLLLAQVYYNTGLAGIVQPDKKQALEYYLRAAQRGNIDAMFFVGNCYYHDFNQQELGKQWWDMSVVLPFIE